MYINNLTIFEEKKCFNENTTNFNLFCKIYVKYFLRYCTALLPSAFLSDLTCKVSYKVVKCKLNLPIDDPALVCLPW